MKEKDGRVIRPHPLPFASSGYWSVRLSQPALTLRMLGRSNYSGVCSADARHPRPLTTAQTVARPGSPSCDVRSAMRSSLRLQTTGRGECPLDMGGAVLHLFRFHFSFCQIIIKQKKFFV